jgi:pimeloyl-ACP methyl ester carboxylesterase
MVDHIEVNGRSIAIAHRAGQEPGLFWLSGFKSDMTGSKALALDAYGARRGLAVTRFDYSGHGRSGGDFAEGTISRWLEEAEAAFATTSGPQIVVGSSMGGWLALLLNRALRRRSDTRVAALVLIAPATDMTDLILAQMPAARSRRRATSRRPPKTAPSPIASPGG